MDLLGDAGATQRSRAGETVITPPFESIWPDVEQRLRGLLYRRGLDQPSSDDIVQEVALRVLSGKVTYTSAPDLLRWAGPVACNLHIDLIRQRSRLHDDEPADRPAWNDVAGEVANRIELQRAFRGIAKLRPADREAIIEAVTNEPTVAQSRKEAVRLAVRRHRARSRLVLLMEQIAAWAAGLGLLRRSRTAVAFAAVPVAVALPLVVAHPFAGGTTAIRPVAPVTVTAQYRTYPAPPAQPRQAAPSTVAKNAAKPATAPPPKVTTARKPAVDLKGPGGVGVKAGGDDRRDDDRIVCVKGVPYLPRICV